MAREALLTWLTRRALAASMGLAATSPSGAATSGLLAYLALRARRETDRAR